MEPALGGDSEGSLREAWEAHALDWIRWARTPAHDSFFWRFNLPAALDLLPPPGRLTVDIGCGEGRFGRELRALGHQVVGVDGSATLARAAAEHSEPLPVVLANASRLPLRSAAADLVTACFVLHDVDDLEGTIAGAGRVLLPGGAFYFSIVHPLNSATEVPSYFESRRTSMTVEREGLRMTFESTHHPLSRYGRALEDAGFVIEAMREPVPDDAWVRDRPSAVKWRRFPHALHVRARRVRGGLM